VARNLTGQMNRKSVKLTPRVEKFYALKDNLLPEPSPRSLEGFAYQRRPTRRRIKPLYYWKGEEFLYAKSKKTGDWMMDKVVFIKTSVATKKRTRRQARQKKKKKINCTKEYFVLQKIQ